MYNALNLSRYIVSKCVEDCHPISNLQLQKILFYIQKDFVLRDTQAFSDSIEAWQFGPVVPIVYYAFCGFGSMAITTKYNTSPCRISTEDKRIIDHIVESKRRLNPWELVEETHKVGGAWYQTYKHGAGNRHVIPIRLIKTAG